MYYLKRWRWLIVLVCIIGLIEYSPLIIPEGKYEPTLFGIPFSLWLGMIFTILVVLLTYLGSKIYLKVIEEGHE